MLNKITVIGPGLIGGSIGLAARHHKSAQRVVLWSRRVEAGEQAYKIGAADETTQDLRKAVTDSNLVILATPIGVMRELTEQMKPALQEGCVVTDVGSVKYPIVAALTDVLDGKVQFIGSHPMTGSEQSGLDAARRDLFENALCIITPRKDDNSTAVKLVHDFWKTIGCSVSTLDATRHDEIVAQVSHLPHMLAAALVNVVSNDDDGGILRYAGPGFKDSTRIASGSAKMWAEICTENRNEIGRALDRVIEELTKYRSALQNSDIIELQAALKKAKHYRDELRFRT